MKKRFILLVVMAMIFGLAVSANATLTVIGTGTINGGTTPYQLIYDSGLNVTWLDYTNPTNTWQNQVNWASSLNVDFNGTNFTGWSLPSTVDAAASGNYPPAPSSSQMAYLYYTDLGNTTAGFTNAGPFKNLLTSWYWSGTEYSASPSDAWDFNFTQGHQGLDAKNVWYYDHGLAVRPGDAAAVPEPGTMILIGTGLAGLAGWKKWAMRRGA